MNSYYIYDDGEFSLKTTEEIFSKYGRGEEGGKRDQNRIWSARLGTGLFGLTSCKSGNRGPKATREVILSVGDEGLEKFIELGFITCPVCKPEESYSDFWNVIKSAVARKYRIGRLEEFTNKDILEYDAMRVDWGNIVPMIGGFPSRLYTRPGLPALDIVVAADYLSSLSEDRPEVGYLDKSEKTWKFVKYPI